MIAEIEVELDLGICPHERCERGHGQRVHDRQADAQPSPRRASALSNLELGGLDLAEDPPTPLEEHRAFVGQHERSRRALEQPDLQPFLEASDCLANRRRRDPELVPRDREALALCGANEGLDLAEIVHPQGWIRIVHQPRVPPVATTRVEDRLRACSSSTRLVE
jgi:hypothetical protein